MINYNSAEALRAFLDERGLGMRKKFGQNFLINPHARSGLLDALELREGDNVWEIGPGLGAMTTGLLERGGKVTAFEIDPAFARILKEIFEKESLGPEPLFRLVEGDALKTWPRVNAGIPAPEPASVPESDLFLLGNLPYNIAAALLADFIEKGRFFNRMVVTVQREVALRMTARPGSPDYSSFSVLCASAYNVSALRVIKGSSFYPSPRVDSQGVRLDLRVPQKKPPELFYPLVRNLFSSRRKTVKNTLSPFASQVIMGMFNKPAGPMGRGCRTASIKQNDGGGEKRGREMAAEVLSRAGISGDRRPETLGIDEFAALASALAVAMEEAVRGEK